MQVVQYQPGITSNENSTCLLSSSQEPMLQPNQESISELMPFLRKPHFNYFQIRSAHNFHFRWVRIFNTLGSNLSQRIRTTPGTLRDAIFQSPF